MNHMTNSEGLFTLVLDLDIASVRRKCHDSYQLVLKKLSEKLS